MPVEIIFSLPPVIGQAKKMVHRTAQHLQARLAYTAAMFNVLMALDRQLQPGDPFRIRIAQFYL